MIDKFGNETQETIKDKKVSFKNTSSKIDNNFNKTYKPSGKFIYENDVLSTIKEIL